MKWSMDTHKYISETTRKALQIIAAHAITSDSEPEEIEAVERELAASGIYKDYESAKGRVRRALFTYYKAYNCMDDNEKLTPVGALFAENKISIKEFCFHYIVNYKYVNEDTSYYPTHILLTCLKKLYEKDPQQAYISAYDFSQLIECNGVEDINDTYITHLLKNRNTPHDEPNERNIGYDVWAKMLVQSGILNRTSDRTLIANNEELIDWILESYSKTLIDEKGTINSGILNYIPILQLEKPHGDYTIFKDDAKALQAYLVDRVDESIIQKYILNNLTTSFSDMKASLGLSDSAYGFYNAFSGLERLVGGVLSLNANDTVRIIGDILINAESVSEDDAHDCLIYKTGLKSAFSRNRILFGAPGTGKSFTLNGDRKEILYGDREVDEDTIDLSQYGEYERVTFHPDYSYANFVGTYKPVSCKDGITYEYVPGPFMRIYVKALLNSKTDTPKPYLLIIEEINRANVAAVFGDVFQLLDRDENEISEYPIQASEDMKKYLAKKLGGDPEDYAEIRIPDNMFIWATMNSADQGVFPMDTAFKRRWDFKYLGIDDSEKGIAGKTVVLGKKIGTQDYRRVVEWNELRKAINEELLKYKVNEDKLMGPYFISKKNLPEGDIIEAEEFSRIFKNKVIMYLFDDAAKQKRTTLFEGCEEKSRNQYSKICNEFNEKGIFIFGNDVSKRFTVLPEDDEQ